VAGRGPSECVGSRFWLPSTATERVVPAIEIMSDHWAWGSIAAQIRAEREEPGPGLLAVERKGTADVIGYCGLTIHGNGSPDEPELAYELLHAAHGSDGRRRRRRDHLLPAPPKAARHKYRSPGS
jgi:hypothetical protein